MTIYGIDGNCLFAGATFSSSSLSPPILIIRTKNSPLWALWASGRLLQKSDVCAGGSAEMCVSVKPALVCEFHKHLPSGDWSVCLSQWLWVAACENSLSEQTWLRAWREWRTHGIFMIRDLHYNRKKRGNMSLPLWCANKAPHFRFGCLYVNIWPCLLSPCAEKNTL